MDQDVLLLSQTPLNPSSTVTTITDTERTNEGSIYYYKYLLGQ